MKLKNKICNNKRLCENYLHVTGNRNFIYGDNCVVEGNYNTVIGYNTCFNGIGNKSSYPKQNLKETQKEELKHKYRWEIKDKYEKVDNEHEHDNSQQDVEINTLLIWNLSQFLEEHHIQKFFEDKECCIKKIELYKYGSTGNRCANVYMMDKKSTTIGLELSGSELVGQTVYIVRHKTSFPSSITWKKGIINKEKISGSELYFDNGIIRLIYDNNIYMKINGEIIRNNSKGKVFKNEQDKIVQNIYLKSKEGPDISYGIIGQPEAEISVESSWLSVKNCSLDDLKLVY